MTTDSSQIQEEPIIEINGPPPCLVPETAVIALVLAGAALILTGGWLFTKS